MHCPDHAWQGFPKLDNHEERKAGSKYVRAALERTRNDFGPGALEALTSHATVLYRESREEARIDEQSAGQGRAGLEGIHGPNEPDGPDKHGEEKEITSDSIKQTKKTFHSNLLTGARRS